MIEKKLSRNTCLITSKFSESLIMNNRENINMYKLINLVLKKNKTGQDIQEMRKLLQKNLDMEYFRKLQSKIPENDYFFFLQSLEIVTFEPNVFVIEKKKKNRHFYIILEGVVDVLDEIFSLKDPKEQNAIELEMINTIQKGDYFGENSLLNIKAVATAWIKSRTHLILLRANYEAFCRTLNKPQIAIQQEKFKFILNNTLFKNIQENFIKEIVSEFRTKIFSLNEKIYCKGEKQNQLYLIYSGEVQLRKFNENRKQTNKSFGLVIIGEGEYFGIQDEAMVQQFRTETAISKSNELIVHKIFFKRLKILKTAYEQFCKNLSKNLKKKISLYNDLCMKHDIICNFNKSLTQKTKKRTDLKRYKIKKNKPSLEWWGVTQNMNHSKVLLINKKNLTIAEKQGDKERQIIFTNSRIKAFLNQFKYRKSLAQGLQQQDEQQSSYVSPFDYRSTIPPKSLKKQSQNSKLKLKVLPSIRKQNLIHYARSQNSFVQKLLIN